MKNRILIATVLLTVSSIVNAQQRRDPFKDPLAEYFNCVNRCPQDDPRTSTDENAMCQKICLSFVKCPTVKAGLKKAPILKATFTHQQVDGKLSILIDESYKYFAIYNLGELLRYEVINKKGIQKEMPLATVVVGNEKRYFIFDKNGNYFQVKKPKEKGLEIFDSVAKM